MINFNSYINLNSLKKIGNAYKILLYMKFKYIIYLFMISNNNI